MPQAKQVLEELQWLLAHSLSGHQTLTFQAHHLGLLTFDKFQSVLRVTASVLSIHHLHSVNCGVDWILQVFLCKYKEVSQSRLFHTTPTTPTISCEECSRYIHIMKDKQKSDILQFHPFLNARPPKSWIKSLRSVVIALKTYRILWWRLIDLC
jgi:hypothetical protein